MSKISAERQTAYYVGNAMTVLGVILFFSVFVTGFMNAGNFNDFEGQARSSGLCALSGMILIFVGQFVANVGAKGLAGSGVILNPEEAREDLKPYSHQAGGMLSDTLDKANLREHLGSVTGQPQQVVMIRCLACEKLNEEDSKFCQECGEKI